MDKNILYIFLDEGGNLDFSPSGSKYFSLTCVSMFRPFSLHTRLDTYKYDLIEHGLDIESFHCTYDNRHIRKNVFDMLKLYSSSLRIDSLLVEKKKTSPVMQKCDAFYPQMLGYLLSYVLRFCDSRSISEVVVITDSIPIKKKRGSVEKAIKTTLSKMLKIGTPYRLMHHSSKAHYGLQVADYCNWAIFRKWERGDGYFYDFIRGAVNSEYDIFRFGEVYYY